MFFVTSGVISETIVSTNVYCPLSDDGPPLAGMEARMAGGMRCKKRVPGWPTDVD